MFALIVFFLCLTTGVRTQGVFAPPEFTESSCTGNNRWTIWFDSNDPSSSTGEFEVTTHLQQIFPAFMCPVPVAIEVILSILTSSTKETVFRYLYS